MRARVMVAATAVALVAGLTFGASPASADSGHFIEGGAGAPQCVDVGTQVTCVGKVAGLGSTAFEITLAASGIALGWSARTLAATWPPAKTPAVTVAGTTEPQATPRNGQARFTLTLLPIRSRCRRCRHAPTSNGYPNIVDVSFTTATLTLLKDGAQTDQVVVLVQ